MSNIFAIATHTDQSSVIDQADSNQAFTCEQASYSHEYKGSNLGHGICTLDLDKSTPALAKKFNQVATSYLGDFPTTQYSVGTDLYNLKNILAFVNDSQKTSVDLIISVPQLQTGQFSRFFSAISNQTIDYSADEKVNGETLTGYKLTLNRPLTDLQRLALTLYKTYIEAQTGLAQNVSIVSTYGVDMCTLYTLANVLLAEQTVAPTPVVQQTVVEPQPAQQGPSQAELLAQRQAAAQLVQRAIEARNYALQTAQNQQAVSQQQAVAKALPQNATTPLVWKHVLSSNTGTGNIDYIKARWFDYYATDVGFKNYMGDKLFSEFAGGYYSTAANKAQHNIDLRAFNQFIRSDARALYYNTTDLKNHYVFGDDKMTGVGQILSTTQNHFQNNAFYTEYEFSIFSQGNAPETFIVKAFVELQPDSDRGIIDFEITSKSNPTAKSVFTLVKCPGDSDQIKVDKHTYVSTEAAPYFAKKDPQSLVSTGLIENFQARLTGLSQAQNQLIFMLLNAGLWNDQL